MHDRGKIFGIRSADSKLDRFAFSLLIKTSNKNILIVAHIHIHEFIEDLLLHRLLPPAAPLLSPDPLSLI